MKWKWRMAFGMQTHVHVLEEGFEKPARWVSPRAWYQCRYGASSFRCCGLGLTYCQERNASCGRIR
jgi:hypothetical protein